MAVVAAALPGSALGAGPVSLEAIGLVAGRFEAGGWAAISVALANDGEPVSGYVAAESEDGTVRRLVELPAGSRKEVPFYVRPPAFARELAIRFEARDGTSLATATVDLRVLERTAGNVAIVGDGGGNLRPQLIARTTGLPEPIPMTAADLPERPEPLRGIETILWADDSGGLTEAQGRALERWIAAGGQLVVLGGPDWQGRAAAFDHLLPVTGLRASDDASIRPLGDWVGAAAPPGVETLTVSTGTLVPGAVELVSAQDGALFASIARGAGRVAWLGVDMATEPFRSWPGAPLLWQRMLPDTRLAQQLLGSGPLDEEIANFMVQALDNLPVLEVPPAELLLAVLVAYILLIGPISYVVLTRLDRRELAWITAPLLVIVFSAGTFGIGMSMKGSDIILNEIAVVRSTTDGTAASVTTFAGVYSPRRASYDLTVRDEALLSALRANLDGTGASTAAYATEQGDPSHLRGLAVSVFGIEAIRADTVVPYAPSLRVTWSLGGEGTVGGTVANEGQAALSDVAVVTQNGGLMIGALEPGASRTFELDLGHGASASAEIYGPDGFDASSAAQRQILLRRQVIDSLIGYGREGRGWIDQGPVGVDRGPFVIGWRAGASPVEVEVDGHEVQRYVQTVEVLSGRPRLGPGPVSLSPSQMATNLVAVNGEASENEPGYVSVANGEAVFQVALPLEASQINPSGLTLIAGTDPSMIVFNQASVSSLMPDGFRMAAYDHGTDEWVDIGDLSLRSRFEVEQPSRLLDPAGRIMVRVVGADLPDDFGRVNVFVGAALEGVI